MKIPKTPISAALLAASMIALSSPSRAFLVFVQDNEMIMNTIQVADSTLRSIEMAQRLKRQSEQMKDAMASGDRSAMARSFLSMSGTIGAMYDQVNLAAVGFTGGNPLLSRATTDQIRALSRFAAITGGADFQNPGDLANVLRSSQAAGIDLPVISELDGPTMLSLYRTVRGGVTSSKNGRYLDTLDFARDLVNFPYEDTGLQGAAEDIGQSAIAIKNFFTRNYAPSPTDDEKTRAEKAERRRVLRQRTAMHAISQAAAGAHSIEDHALAQETFQRLIEDSEDIRTDLQVMNHLLLHLARVQSQNQVLIAERIKVASLKEITYSTASDRISDLQRRATGQ